MTAYATMTSRTNPALVIPLSWARNEDAETFQAVIDGHRHTNRFEHDEWTVAVIEDDDAIERRLREIEARAVGESAEGIHDPWMRRAQEDRLWLIQQLRTAREAVVGAPSTPHMGDKTATSEDVFTSGDVRVTIDDIIAYVEGLSDDQWQLDVVRSEDGTRNCFFGHLFNLGFERAPGAVGERERVANALWEWFEEFWTTTYVVYPINDGASTRYPEPTPKARILHLLRDLRDGVTDRTHIAMEKDYLASTEARV